MSGSVESGPPSLRRATRDDLTAVQQLLTLVTLPTVGVDTIFELDAEDFVVATDPAQPTVVIATGGLEVRGRDALLRSIAVHPAWQAHGLGAQVVSRLIEAAEQRGLTALYLLTTTAERYFPRFGFERVARGDVSPAIAQTDEFAGACPASAIAMSKRVRTNTAH